MSVTFSPKRATDPATQSTPKKARFLKAYATVCQVTLAARMAGIDRGTHYDWLQKDPEYRAKFERAQEVAIQALEDEAVRRAYEGVERPVYQGGEKVGVIREYSDTLLIFLLKGLRPAKYRERYDVVVEAGDSLVQAIARGRARALALSAGEERTIDIKPEESGE